MDKKKMKIILVRPYGYFGGTLVIDLLCKLLREKGVDAQLLYTQGYMSKDINTKKFWRDFIEDALKHLIYEIFHLYFDCNSSDRAKFYQKRYKETMPGLKRKILPFFQKKNTIVLYPEIIYGNYLKAKHVVRWLLSYNHFKDDPDAFGKEDLIICYRKQFNDWQLNPKCLEVNIAYFDSEKYRQYNFGEREGKCYIIRKGRSRTDLPQHFDGPIIDRGIEEEEIVRILNTHKYCYSYDTQTFYCQIAAVCGCIPIIVMEPGKSKKDYRTEDELKNSVGIAFGDTPEEIQHAISTREELIRRLDFSKRNEENVEKFIQIVTERFGEIR